MTLETVVTPLDDTPNTINLLTKAWPWLIGDSYCALFINKDINQVSIDKSIGRHEKTLKSFNGKINHLGQKKKFKQFSLKI